MEQGVRRRVEAGPESAGCVRWRLALPEPGWIPIRTGYGLGDRNAR